MDLKLADESAKLAIEIRAILKRSGSGQGDAAAIPRDLIERIDAIIGCIVPEMATK